MCDHIAKVVSWTVDTSKPTAPLVPGVWGCTNCDETFSEPPVSEEVVEQVVHENDCECFGCRARSIRVAYCGIGGGDATTQKNWDKDIDLYRKARSQGIQPTGTSKSKVMAAIKQSEKTGEAFKAS